MEKKRVIIIGAGPAGLTAAYELLKEKENYEITILEETQEIGGISKTIKYKGNRMDIGGHRFFSKDQRVMDFWKEIMPLQGSPSFDDQKLKRKKTLEKKGPDPNQEDKVMLVRTRISRIYYNKKFFDYPITLKWETLKNMGCMKTIRAGGSYLVSLIFKKKETSLENFYINRFGKVLYQMFFEKYTEKLWGRNPSEIAADWGAQRVKGLSITAILKDIIHKKLGKKHEREVETSLIEEFWYPKYGPGQWWEELARQIQEKGGRIQKGCCVKRILVEDRKVQSVVCQIEGKKQEIKADIVISSMPLKDLVEGIEDKQLPTSIRNIAKGLPYRDFITVGLLVNKLNLKNKTQIKTLGDIVPDCWIYIQEPDVKIGRIQIFNNWSPYLLQDPENTVWIGAEYFCTEGDELWNKTESECIHFVVEELEKIGVLRKEDVKDAHQEKIKKAYPAYFDTYAQIHEVIDYLNGYDNLYCIGRNGQHRYNNMDHSMLTAIEAANNIKQGRTDKSNIWNVNVEQQYHEEKEKREKK